MVRPQQAAYRFAPRRAGWDVATASGFKDCNSYSTPSPLDCFSDRRTETASRAPPSPRVTMQNRIDQGGFYSVIRCRRSCSDLVGRFGLFVPVTEK